MTSPANHRQTIGFLQEHGFFGLPESDVILFSQGMLPALDFQGRLLLEQKHRLALAPDGHGGSLKALVNSGAHKDMQARGIEIISYFQIDNPLVKPFDPLFIGLHARTGSEMSTKVTPKADDLERVGNLCIKDGKLAVVEYSDFPNELARAKNEDGSRRFDAGNLAIHLLDVGFVERVIAKSFELPFRRAEKKVAFIDENGTQVDPPEPNAIKLETFVFDALPLANKPLVLAVDRAEEFSPVKNATGVDSLETSQRDQVRRACRWLEAAGVKVPRKPDGEPGVTVAISPAFALDAEDVATHRDRLPPLSPGDELYIE
jgi:UDP-N-acetylglucosamine/UDP-N-acetylgalactosamine diphosphorylase